MIKGIYSVELESKNSSVQKTMKGRPFASSSFTSAAAKNLSGYSLSALQANYLPLSSEISFKGTAETGSKGNVSKPKNGKTPVNLRRLKQDLIAQLPDDSSFVVSRPVESQKIKGSFYKKLINDVSILLKSDKDAIVVEENGVTPEIFVKKFGESVSDGYYNKIGFDSASTDVIYIKDPMAFARYHYSAEKILSSSKEELSEIVKDGKIVQKAFDPEEAYGFDSFLSGMSKLNASAESPRIVVVQDFEKVLSQMGRFYSGKNLKEHLKSEYPNLSIVGIVNKQMTDVPSSLENNLSDEHIQSQKNLLTHLNEMPQLKLSGFNTKETGEFLQKNPDYITAVLDKYLPLNLEVTPEFTQKLIATSAAKDLDSALPGSFFVWLDRIAAAKLNEATPKRYYETLRLTPEDVDGFLENHKDLANISKNPHLQVNVAENVKTRFRDVAGLDLLKNRIKEDYFECFKNPKAYLATGRDMPGGLLLVGPPGTGKTTIVRAIAGELEEFTGKKVAVFFMNGTSFGNQYINSGANALRDAYNNARDYMRKTGSEFGFFCIDEIDPICRKVGSSTSNNVEDEKTMTELKAQMSSFTTKDPDVRLFTIGTTNHPEVFAEELLRPERFSQVSVDVLRTNKDIRALLELKSKNKPFESAAEKSRLLDRLTGIVKGLNGDQMTKILDESTRIALKSEKKFITEQAITDACMNVMMSEVSDSNYTKEEKLLASLHEVGHAEAKAESLFAISNEPRGHAAAVTFFVPDDRMFHDFDSVIDEISCDYGGAEAEKLLNKAHGSGVSQDYSDTTELLEKALKKWSLGIYTPQRSFYTRDGVELVELSKQYASEMKKDGEIFAETGQRVIKQRLKAHRNFILNKYIKENEEAITAGKNGKNYLRQEYLDLRTQWLKMTGEIKAEPVLENGIRAIKTIAFNDKFWTQRAKVENARNIMSDGVESIIGFSQEKSWLTNKNTTAETLNKKIDEIVALSENGNKWVAKVGADNIEKKLIKAVNKIVESAKNSDKNDILEIVRKTIKSVV